MEKFVYDGMSIWVREGQHNANDKYTVGEVRSYGLPDFKPETIVDVGAHIGAFSCWMAQLYPQADIVAVEPERDNFKVLRENCRQLWMHAVFGYMSYLEDGLEATLKTHPEIATMHKIVHDGTGDRFAPEQVYFEWIMEEYTLEGIDLLKIDCEGCEISVLTNCDLGPIRFITGERHQEPEEFMDTIAHHLTLMGFEVETTMDPLAHATFTARRRE